MLDQRGVTLFDALLGFYQEHEHCGDLNSGDHVWMRCTCGAGINRDDRD